MGKQASTRKISDKIISNYYANSNAENEVSAPLSRSMVVHHREWLLLGIVSLMSLFVYLSVFVLVFTGSISSIFLFVLFLPLIMYIIRGFQWGMAKENMVPMTPEQFPDGWLMVEKISRDFGVEVPEAYVMLGNGNINAMAAGHEHKRYIVVSSDLFEVGGQARNPDALEFVISHEIGHIAAGHTSYWRIICSYIGMMIPILGSALSRSQEYTADNYASSRAIHGANSTIGVLAVGKYLGSSVDSYNYGASAIHSSMWSVMVNAFSSHPVLRWRAHALLCSQNGAKRGSLFFPPDSVTIKRKNDN